jgi:hypothetical protein
MNAYDIHRQATLHRPTDLAGIAAAARQLAGTGLKPRDIASILGLTEAGVIQALGGQERALDEGKGGKPTFIESERPRIFGALGNEKS